jgi:hypothetical protein
MVGPRRIDDDVPPEVRKEFQAMLDDYFRQWRAEVRKFIETKRKPPDPKGAS